MKKIIIISILIITSGIFWVRENSNITNEKDYTSYLSQQPSSSNNLRLLENDMQFWKKRMQADTSDLVSRSKVAGLTAKHYHFSGNVNELQYADSLYKVVNRINRNFGSGTYRSLAANCITMHRFREASAYLDSALVLGDDKDITLTQKVDVDIELGNMIMARKILNEFADKKSVEYLVREAKLKDHEGDLKTAITLMEEAYERLKKDKTESLYSWALTNLGDMYGHDNRYEDSYRSYLNALKWNPAEFHALKGIAWLAFSHDKNTKAAKNILTSLKKIHPVPDYDLMLSKIAAYENDQAAKQNLETAFLDEVTKPAYGGMYNKYIFYLLSDELNETNAAYELALKEVSSRPTGESYNLLTWSLYKKGNITEAMRLASLYVEHKCYEPDAIYHLGILYKAAGNRSKAKRYLREADKSVFEMGPSFENDINDQLRSL